MFLEDVPLSGIAICYAPLLLTVLGFIFFAALTDLNARRTYLRRDLRRGQAEHPFIAETPAGAEVLIGPNGARAALATGAPASPLVPAPAPTPPVPEAPPADAGAEDDLTRIEGIGPKTRDALHASGIRTFAQVAQMSGEELTRIVKEEHGVRLVGDAATWARQAQFLVAGDEVGLQAYQNSLIGGREP